jgi:anti-anti-sigma factor
MTPGDRRLRFEMQSLPDLDGDDRQAALIRLSGEIDAGASAELAARLRAFADGRPKDLVIDLSGVTFLSTAGAEAVMTFGTRRAAEGRRLLVGGGSGQVQRLLDLVRAADVLDLHPTVDAAIAAYAEREGGPGGVRAENPARLRAQIRRLRADLRTRPVVARAMGILQGRYRLTDGDAAFALLRDGSQTHNLKLRALAAALLTTPPPESAAAELWFPERVRTPPPAMTFSALAQQNHDNRSTVLEAVLSAGLACTGTRHGAIHLVDPVEGGLQLELQQGFPAEFADVFAYVKDQESAAALALRRGERVVVTDVATDPLFSEPRSMVLRQAGCRSAQSTPLIAPDGPVLGTLSTYDTRPGRHLSPAETAQLDLVAREAGAWLDWHRRTVVLDALEFLHQRVRERDPLAADEDV